MAQPTATRVDILQWVNRVLMSRESSGWANSPFTNLSQVPAKATAKLLNAMFGSSRCPIHEILFDDQTPTTALRNRRKVLDLARRLGYDGALDPIKWGDGKDFANELVFWKWLYSHVASNPIPVGYDFSLSPAAPSSGHQTAPLPPAPIAQRVQSESSAFLNAAAVEEPTDTIRKRRREADDVLSPSSAPESHFSSGDAAPLKEATEAPLVVAYDAAVNALSQGPHCSTTQPPSESSGQAALLLAATQASAATLESLRSRILAACRERDQGKLLAALSEVP